MGKRHKRRLREWGKKRGGGEKKKEERQEWDAEK